MFLDYVTRDFFAALALLARRARGDHGPDKWAEQFPRYEGTADPSLTPWSLFERWIAKAKPASSTVNRWRGVFLRLQSDFPNTSAAALLPEQMQEWATFGIYRHRSRHAAPLASENVTMKFAPLDAFSRLRMVSLVTRSVPASPFWRLWMRPVSSRRLSSPDQRLDILKFDPKNGDVIGTSHIASLTASALRGNRSPSAVLSLPADFSLAPKVLDQCLEVRKRYPVSSSP